MSSFPLRLTILICVLTNIFSSLFSLYNMHGSGGLDELLKKDNVTIEELLDEENLVVELKNASSKIHVLYSTSSSPSNALLS